MHKKPIVLPLILLAFVAACQSKRVEKIVDVQNHLELTIPEPNPLTHQAQDVEVFFIDTLMKFDENAYNVIRGFPINYYHDLYGKVKGVKAYIPTQFYFDKAGISWENDSTFFIRLINTEMETDGYPIKIFGKDSAQVVYPMERYF